MVEETVVDMGKYVVAHNPDVLIALGLGSCVGAAVIDSEMHIGGLAHIMLPHSSECKRENTEGFNMNKFADIAIPSLIRDMELKGCKRERIKAKIAGGAHMFKNIVGLEVLDIGKRNIDAVKHELGKLNIPIVAEETGGSIGRTVKFDLKTSILQIKTLDGLREI
ncbi:chemotaxis protein CheD [Candidatus Woesearchaeota archaeon]|nr:chemotaxis protein CheD [Candidatus Woesearchaeota archaeon]